MYVRILGAACGSLILVSTASARSSYSGTWVGPGEIIKGVPICTGGSDVGCQLPALRALSTYRLTFRGSGIQYYAEGPTGATHDPISAKGTCRMRLTLDHVAGGWTYYIPVARATFAGEGGPGVFCQTTRLKNSSVALRIRPAGAKLRVEFGEAQIQSKYKSYTYLSRTA